MPLGGERPAIGDTIEHMQEWDMTTRLLLRHVPTGSVYWNLDNFVQRASRRELFDL
jgi:hypothetical protein